MHHGGVATPPRPVRPVLARTRSAEATAPDDLSGKFDFASGLVKFHAPEVVLGPDSLSEAGYAAARLGARRPFVVSDPGIVEAGWVGELPGLLQAAALLPVLWTEVTPNPKDAEIRRAYERYGEAEADVIVAIGGGSCMDAAKRVAVPSGKRGDILDYAAIDQMAKPIPPMLMIPSTSGTGADVSQFCIATDTQRRVKLTRMGRALVPDTSITDPRQLTTMPDWRNAATGPEPSPTASSRSSPLRTTRSRTATRWALSPWWSAASDPVWAAR